MIAQRTIDIGVWPTSEAMVVDIAYREKIINYHPTTEIVRYFDITLSCNNDIINLNIDHMYNSRSFDDNEGLRQLQEANEYIEMVKNQPIYLIHLDNYHQHNIFIDVPIISLVNIEIPEEKYIAVVNGDHVPEGYDQRGLIGYSSYKILDKSEAALVILQHGCYKGQV